MRYYLERLKPSFWLFIAVQLLIRTLFVVWEWHSLEGSSILKAYLMGVVFDGVTYVLLLLPYIAYLLLLPARWHHTRLDRLCTHGAFLIFAVLIVFDIASEYAFWEEFAVRFNFIAIDYLVYTDEVVGNIIESYPMVPILLAVMLMVGAAYAVFRHTLIPADEQFTPPSWQQKLLSLGAFMAVAVVGYAGLQLEDKNISKNTYANEIAANGIYSLFSAFMNNELAYDEFYITFEELTGTKLLTRSPRVVESANPEQRKNVIVIMMESMGADYLAMYGNTENLTPNLDRLAQSSLNFTQLYANGTRTVRGLEALTLSVPPSPGRSIVKYPENEKLFSLGYVFKDRGYRAKFIYGGFGYFDNMNYFYDHNGFDVVDRSNLSDDEIRFANVWGISDEDLFTRVIKEARHDSARDKPFLYMVMTTSNHRPYTFPPNDQGIAEEGGGRLAGVRYADYAIGKLMAAAEKELWFKDTVFVIVADHTAGASGKTSLPPWRYHIPAMIYAPDAVKPQQVGKLASQIDLPVTLLDVLGFDYRSTFYGQNILADDFEERAFLATHQKLGLYKNKMVTFIEPVKAYGAETEQGEVMDTEDVSLTSPDLREAVLHYNSASQWKTNHRKLPSTLIENDN